MAHSPQIPDPASAHVRVRPTAIKRARALAPRLQPVIDAGGRERWPTHSDVLREAVARGLDVLEAELGRAPR